METNDILLAIGTIIISQILWIQLWLDDKKLYIIYNRHNIIVLKTISFHIWIYTRAIHDDQLEFFHPSIAVLIIKSTFLFQFHSTLYLQFLIYNNDYYWTGHELIRFTRIQCIIFENFFLILFPPYITSLQLPFLSITNAFYHSPLIIPKISALNTKNKEGHLPLTRIDILL